MGWSSEEAAQLLERAFGWRTQTFWRGMKKEEIPDPSQIAASISFLSTELGERPWKSTRLRLRDSSCCAMRRAALPGANTLQIVYFQAGIDDA